MMMTQVIGYKILINKYLHVHTVCVCVKLTYSLTGLAGLVKYFNTRPAVMTWH